jgi:hypothetical protein
VVRTSQERGGATARWRMGKGRSQNNQVAREAGNTRSMGFPLRHQALLTHGDFKVLAVGPYNNEMMSYVILEWT